MKTFNDVIVSGASMAANVTSPAIDLTNIYGFCIQSVVTGTPTGTLKLQGSCDYAALTAANVVNWTDIASSSHALSGAAASYLDNFDAQHYRWVRVVYTATSGSGSLTCTINAKGV